MITHRLVLPAVLLALTCLAHAADPPADKKDPADRYAVRLAAAAAIDDSADKAKALLQLAVEAAEAGQDEVVKKCMAVYPKSITLGDTDNGLCRLTIELAGAGYEAEALEAAKALGASSYRNTALGGIAAGHQGGAAALWRACEKGDDDGVAWLWVSAPLNAKDRDGETGLMKAAANGHVAVVKRLLAAEKVEVWEVDKQGRTALMKAAENGQDAVVRVILGKYSNKPYPKDEPLNLTDSQGRTALMLAAAKGHVGVVQVLLNVRYSSDPDDPLSRKRFLTIEREAGPPVATPFENSLVDRDRKDNDGKTALELAEAAKHAAVVELLKKAGQ